MSCARIALWTALLTALAAASGVPLNKLIVKWGPIPKLFCFYDLPRTDAAAMADRWTVAADLRDSKGYSLWCREDDYRVCLLFDLRGSVAGIQISHSVADMKATKVPQDWDTIPDWNRQTILGEDVYSAIAYFVDPASLPSGGRTLTDDSNTAEGIWIEQQGERLRVPLDERELAASTGTNFTRQGCMFGMGRHYFWDMRKESHCEDRRPYYLLYGPKTEQLHGFGVITFGKTSQRSIFHRRWFINPPAFVTPIVAPDGPSCTRQWMSEYGATLLHVYFQAAPWSIHC